MLRRHRERAQRAYPSHAIRMRWCAGPRTERIPSFRGGGL